MSENTARWNLKKINLYNGNRFVHWIEISQIDQSGLPIENSKAENNRLLVLRVISHNGGQVKPHVFRRQESAESYFSKVQTDKADWQTAHDVQKYTDPEKLWHDVIAFSPLVDAQKASYTAQLKAFGIDVERFKPKKTEEDQQRELEELLPNYGTW